MNEDVQAEAGEVTVTRSMIDSMRAIKPWTTFLAVLGFVCVGFMILIGSLLMVFANMIPHQKHPVPPFIGFFYYLFSALYFMPAFYLYKYSSSIGRFLKSSTGGDLESALSYQKSFWKFVGFLALIGIALGILAVAAALIIPILAKLRMHEVM